MHISIASESSTRAVLSHSFLLIHMELSPSLIPTLQKQGETTLALESVNTEGSVLPQKSLLLRKKNQ